MYNIYIILFLIILTVSCNNSNIEKIQNNSCSKDCYLQFDSLVYFNDKDINSLHFYSGFTKDTILVYYYHNNIVGYKTIFEGINICDSIFKIGNNIFSKRIDSKNRNNICYIKYKERYSIVYDIGENVSDSSLLFIHRDSISENVVQSIFFSLYKSKLDDLVQRFLYDKPYTILMPNHSEYQIKELNFYTYRTDHFNILTEYASILEKEYHRDENDSGINLKINNSFNKAYIINNYRSK